MKTKEEIVELVRALKYYRSEPCDCLTRGSAHLFQCIGGGRMMDAQIEGLLWVLGESLPGVEPRSGVIEELLQDFRSE